VIVFIEFGRFVTPFFPQQKLISPVELLIRDTGEDIPEPSLRINFLELSGFHEGVRSHSKIISEGRLDPHCVNSQVT
jgi:hypothetical protein